MHPLRARHRSDARAQQQGCDRRSRCRRRTFARPLPRDNAGRRPRRRVAAGVVDQTAICHDEYRRPGRTHRRGRGSAARRRKAGAPVDARRDARRRAGALAVRPDARIPVAAGQGAASGAVHVRRPGVRGRGPRTFSASRWQSSCCTTPFWCTTTSPTAARCAVAGRRWRRSTAWRPR